MATKEEVQHFLNQLKEKVKVFQIIYLDNRNKNAQTLLDLEINGKYRDSVIQNLKTEDYSEGPRKDDFNQISDIWVFGKIVKGHEIYIKISLGRINSNIICISFHIAEKPMTYPFK